MLLLDILHRSFLLLVIPTSINILEIPVVSRILFDLEVHGLSVLVTVPGLVVFGRRNLLTVCKIVSAVLRFLSLKLLRAISIGSRRNRQAILPLIITLHLLLVLLLAILVHLARHVFGLMSRRHLRMLAIL